MGGMFTLDANRVPIPCFDVREWGEWYATADRRVALTEGDGWHVSTVFLGLDHNFFPAGDPLLFETMVFWGDESGDMDRYATWAQAAAGHERIASMLAMEAREAQRRSLDALRAIAGASVTRAAGD